MSRRRRVARLAGLVAVIAVTTTTGTAIAGHLATDVKSYTGCLTPGGTLYKIAEGDAPRKPCISPDVVAHVSGGDITSITAGTGLTGGGTNGAVGLAIASGYRLPQGCETGQVAKWDGAGWQCEADDSNQYTAGTGLELNGNEFSLDDSYRLPQGCEIGQAAGWGTSPTSLGSWQCTQYTYAGESCPSGQFAHATDEDGRLVCASPSSGAASLTVLSAQQASPGYEDGTGIPDDGNWRLVASVTPSAVGTYVVFAKGVLDETTGDRSGFQADLGGPNGQCALFQGASTELDRVGAQFIDHDLGDLADKPFSLMGVATGQAGVPFSLQCRAGWDDIGIRFGRIVAMKVG